MAPYDSRKPGMFRSWGQLIIFVFLMGAIVALVGLGCLAFLFKVVVG